jgi:hypothetical protein
MALWSENAMRHRHRPITGFVTSPLYSDEAPDAYWVLYELVGFAEGLERQRETGAERSECFPGEFIDCVYDFIILGHGTFD